MVNQGPLANVLYNAVHLSVHCIVGGQVTNFEFIDRKQEASFSTIAVQMKLLMDIPEQVITSRNSC